jgi:hypothetical protein
MNYIDVKNFRKYEQLFGDNGPAKIGHVNAVIKGLNEEVSSINSSITTLTTGLATKISKYDGPTYNINALVSLTAAEYALITPDPNTIYFVI